MTSALPRPSDPVTPWPNIAKALGPSWMCATKILSDIFLKSIFKGHGGLSYLDVFCLGNSYNLNCALHLHNIAGPMNC